MARRSRSAAEPTTATDRFFLRASLPKARSTRENQAEPSRGRQNAAANAIAVRPPSISIKEGPCSGAEGRTISEYFPHLCLGYGKVRCSRSLRFRIVLQRHFSYCGIKT